MSECGGHTGHVPGQLDVRVRRLAAGALLQADRVIAISPQVNISSGWLAEIGDDRWARKIAEIGWRGFDRLDLLPLYERLAPPDARVLLSTRDPFDCRHAERLTEPGLVRGVPFPAGDH